MPGLGFLDYRQSIASLMSKDLAQKQLSPIRLRVIEKGFGLILFNDLAFIHENYTVSHLVGKAHLMRDNQHSHASFSQLNHRVQHLFDHFWVKC